MVKRVQIPMSALNWGCTAHRRVGDWRGGVAPETIARIRLGKSTLEDPWSVRRFRIVLVFCIYMPDDRDVVLTG